MPASEPTLARLAAADLLRRDGAGYRTTRRWQGALARAAAVLRAQDAPFDPRLPIVVALVELYGPDHPDDELVEDVEALLQIEGLEHAPPAP